MSPGVKYFYASGMRIPVDRAFVELPDKTMRRVVVEAPAANTAEGVITLEELVNSDIDTVLVSAHDGLFSLPFDPTRARGRQRVAASTTWLGNIYRSLPLSKRAALAEMQMEMMPRTQRTLSWESHNRLVAAIPHLSPGVLATVVKKNDGSLAYVNAAVLSLMLEHDVESTHEIIRWAAENPNGSNHVDSFATVVAASPLIDEALRQEISTSYVARVHLRLPQRLSELEVLAASARAGVSGVATVLKRALRPIFERDNEHAALRARFDIRCLGLEVLNAMCHEVDAPHAAVLLTHIGDLVSQPAFDLLVAANPVAALETHPQRVSASVLETTEVPATIVAATRFDLLSHRHREWFLQNPHSMSASFAASLTDAEFQSVTATPEQLNVIVRNLPAAPVLVNRLSDELREDALVFLVEALEDLAEEEDPGAFLSMVTSREQYRLVEEALETVPSRRRARLLDALCESNRFVQLRLASSLSVRQMAAALDDAAMRLSIDSTDTSVRSALQSFIARRDSLLKRTDPSLRAAIELGIADAEDILAGLVDETITDAVTVSLNDQRTTPGTALTGGEVVGSDEDDDCRELLDILSGSSARVAGRVTKAAEEGQLAELFQSIEPFRPSPEESTHRPALLEDLLLPEVVSHDDLALYDSDDSSPEAEPTALVAEDSTVPPLSVESRMRLSDEDIERIALRVASLSAHDAASQSLAPAAEELLLEEPIDVPQELLSRPEETVTEAVLAPVAAITPQVIRTVISEGPAAEPLALRLPATAPDQQVVKLEVEVVLTPETSGRLNELSELLPQLSHLLDLMSTPEPDSPVRQAPKPAHRTSRAVAPPSASIDESTEDLGHDLDHAASGDPTDVRYVSSAHRKAVHELSRLRDEAAVFSVMMTSTSIAREARWARRKLGKTAKKLQHIETVLSRFPA